MFGGSIKEASLEENRGGDSQWDQWNEQTLEERVDDWLSIRGIVRGCPADKSHDYFNEIRSRVSAQTMKLKHRISGETTVPDLEYPSEPLPSGRLSALPCPGTSKLAGRRALLEEGNNIHLELLQLDLEVTLYRKRKQTAPEQLSRPVINAFASNKRMSISIAMDAHD